MPPKRGKKKASKPSPSTSSSQLERQAPAKFEGDPLEPPTSEQPINGSIEVQLSGSEIRPEAAEGSEPRSEASEVGPGQAQPEPWVMDLIAQNEALRKDAEDLRKQIAECQEQHALAVARAGDGLNTRLHAGSKLGSRMTTLRKQQLDVDERRHKAWSSIKAVLCDVNAIAKGVPAQLR